MNPARVWFVYIVEGTRHVYRDPQPLEYLQEAWRSGRPFAAVGRAGEVSLVTKDDVVAEPVFLNSLVKWPEYSDCPCGKCGAPGQVAKAIAKASPEKARCHACHALATAAKEKAIARRK